MLKPLLLATFAAIGNALFVYGQRSAPPSENPFLFMAAAIFVCSSLFLAIALAFRSTGDIYYFNQNLIHIFLSGIGLFITFVGFYFLYSRYGANQYTLFAVISIITTSIGVGVLIFKEPFNMSHGISLLCTFGAIGFFAHGQ